MAKKQTGNTLATLTNVTLASIAMAKLINRNPHLPGFSCLYGPAGWGKSEAAKYCRQTHNAYYIQCKKTWSQKGTLAACCKAMGLDSKGTAEILLDRVCEHLAKTGRPLIIDELDKMVDKKSVEVIRDILDGTGEVKDGEHLPSILLIGEEMIPRKLQRWDRFHGRVSQWVPVQPASLEDCKKMASHYCGDLDIAEDLLHLIWETANGSYRRIVVNLDLVATEAAETGMTEITRADWQATGKELYTGKVAIRGFVNDQK